MPHTITIVVFRIYGEKLFGRYKGFSWTIKNDFGYKVKKKEKERYSSLDKKKISKLSGADSNLHECMEI